MIFVSGSIAHDYIMTYDGNFADHILPDKLPQLSMGFGIANLEKYDGGAGHNIAYGLGQLGAKEQTVLRGSVGKDFIKHEHKNIDYSYLTSIDYLNTATGFIFTDKDNNQITPFYPGAMGLIHGEDIQSILDAKTFSYAIISPNDTQAMVPHMQVCKTKGITTIFDPGQCIHFLSNEQLIEAGKIADMLIMNEYERSLWVQKTGLDEHNVQTIAHTIIVTLGERGVKYWTRNDNQWTMVDPIHCDNVVDPTGAGDALRGGLLFGLLNTKTLKESLEIGQQLAWHCIQSAGAQNYKIN